MQKFFNLITSLNYLISLVFICSGFLKLLDPTVLFETMQNVTRLLELQFIKLFLIYAVPTFLPVIEIVAGLGFFIPKHKKKSLISLIILTGGFILIGHWINLKGDEIDCGCFGAIPASFDLLHLVILYLMNIILCIEYFKKEKDFTKVSALE